LVDVCIDDTPGDGRWRRVRMMVARTYYMAETS
jgi:hypothetical protein